MEPGEEGKALEGLLVPGTDAPGTGGTGAPGTEGTGTPGTGPAADNPEHEIEFGEEGKKEKKKVKLSELKKGYMLNEDYTTKTQDISAEREKIKDLVNWADAIKGDPEATKVILALSKSGLGNKEMLKKVLEVLEGKAEEKKEEVSDDITAMEKELEGMDPETAEAKILKRSIVFNKGLLKQITDLKTTINAQGAGIQERTDATTKKKQDALVVKATKVLNDTLSVLTDAEKGELKFTSDEAKSLWRQLVVSHLKDNPKEYKDEKNFVTTINEVGKKYHGTLQKHGEEVVAKYLKDKKTPILPAGGPGGEKRPEPVTFENLQDSIEKALEATEEAKK